MSSVEDLTNYLEELIFTNVQLKSSIQNALSDQEEIWKQINIKEQLYFSKHIEIFGIPKHTNENCYSIVQNIGSRLGIGLKVINAYRKPEKKINTPTKIVAELEDVTQKKNLMSAIKQNSLYAVHLNETWPATRIYVNNYLTPHYRDLFYKSRMLGKMKNYTFIWYHNMEVRLQKDKSTEVIRINNHSDLSKIV